MHPILEDFRRNNLLYRSIFWADVIDEWRIAPSPMPNRSTIERAHLVVIALEHLSSCIQFLDSTIPGSFRAEADEFRSEWSKDRKVRNFLEHEEAYLAGRGTYQSELDVLADQTGRNVAWIAGRLSSIDVLGKSIPLQGHINRASALGIRLRGWHGQIKGG